MNDAGRSPQHQQLFEDDRYEAIGEFADRAISLWLSVREAAFRHELQTLEVHCPQIRVLTLGVFETVKELSRKGEPAEKAEAA
jgi:hypothetical protein